MEAWTVTAVLAAYVVGLLHALVITRHGSVRRWVQKSIRRL